MTCRIRMPEQGRLAILLCCTAVALHQLFSVALIEFKARLAPHLIEDAWERTLASKRRPNLPWPWADTWPVARLQVPGQGEDLFVLAGDAGNALAFGPGHVLASAPLGSKGLAVIGGHRDTHFAFLRDLQRGDLLRLQLPDRSWRDYRVAEVRVANHETDKLIAGLDRERLLLVTCYPFDAIRPGGPLRYVVEAAPLEQSYSNTFASAGLLL